MTATVLSIVAIGGTFLLAQCACAFTASVAIRRTCDSWIQACRAGALSGSTREVAVSMLEREIEAEPWLSVLRRLGTTAPLLGVVLTAGSIAIGDSGKALLSLTSMGSTPDRLGETVVSLAPLFAGVCAGAVLAIINQVLLGSLAFVERGAIQRAATSIASIKFLDNDDRISRAAAQISTASDALAAALQRLQQATDHGTAQADSLAVACESAAGDLKGALSSLRSSSAVIPEALGEVATKLLQSMTQCGEQVKLAAGSLAEMTATSASQLDTVISKQAALTSQQQRLAATVEHTARAFETALEPLRDPALTGFHDALRKSIAGQEALIASGTNLLDIQRRAASAASELAERFQSATQQVAGVGEKLSSAGYSQLATDLEHLRTGLSQFQGALDSAGQGLNPIISRLTTVTDSASALTNALQGGQASVRELEASLTLAAAGSKSLSSDFAAAGSAMNAAVDRAIAGLDEAARRVRESESGSARGAPQKQGWLWRGSSRPLDDQGERKP